jgi:hypothetical protein
MKTAIVVIISALIATFSLAAEKLPAPSSDTLPKGHPGMAAIAPAKQPKPISGRVLKTMESGGYTYINLKRKEDGKKIWVAIPKGKKIAVGKNIDLVAGEEFRNFESKTLNRKFDSIIFSVGAVSKKGSASSTETLLSTPGSKGAMAAPEMVHVAKASGPGSYTVAELYRKKAELNGRKVVVRGKVVKVAQRIMKMNWIHLQDGTGTAGMKNHDLVVKTKALPKDGDTVTVTGTLLKDKDYGMGYRYEVLIDEADVK